MVHLSGDFNRIQPENPMIASSLVTRVMDHKIKPSMSKYILLFSYIIIKIHVSHQAKLTLGMR